MISREKVSKHLRCAIEAGDQLAVLHDAKQTIESVKQYVLQKNIKHNLNNLFYGDDIIAIERISKNRNGRKGHFNISIKDHLKLDSNTVMFNYFYGLFYIANYGDSIDKKISLKKSDLLYRMNIEIDNIQQLRRQASYDFALAVITRLGGGDYSVVKEMQMPGACV